MHSRDSRGAEVDWVLEDSRVRVLGIEVDLMMTSALKNRCIARDIECTKQSLYAA
jgi:hypothetical protein